MTPAAGLSTRSRHGFGSSSQPGRARASSSSGVRTGAITKASRPTWPTREPGTTPRRPRSRARGAAPDRPVRSSRAARQPLFLVCTHGKHDRCCARYAAAVRGSASSSTSRPPGSTHVGGDRFAEPGRATARHLLRAGRSRRCRGCVDHHSRPARTRPVPRPLLLALQRRRRSGVRAEEGLTGLADPPSPACPARTTTAGRAFRDPSGAGEVDVAEEAWRAHAAHLLSPVATAPSLRRYAALIRSRPFADETARAPAGSRRRGRRGVGGRERVVAPENPRDLVPMCEPGTPSPCRRTSARRSRSLGRGRAPSPEARPPCRRRGPRGLAGTADRPDRPPRPGELLRRGARRRRSPGGRAEHRPARPRRRLRSTVEAGRRRTPPAQP